MVDHHLLATRSGQWPSGNWLNDGAWWAAHLEVHVITWKIIISKKWRTWDSNSGPDGDCQLSLPLGCLVFIVNNIRIKYNVLKQVYSQKRQKNNARDLNGAMGRRHVFIFFVELWLKHPDLYQRTIVRSYKPGHLQNLLQATKMPFKGMVMLVSTSRF